MKHRDVTTSRRHGVSTHRVTSYSVSGWWARRVAFLAGQTALYLSIGFALGAAGYLAIHH